ncbi:MAG TPA: hypothetical protein VFH56_07400 [Acidimicrobiales bacterium]|nr:hypothetical protein [Acidimicrobiales bacterium]
MATTHTTSNATTNPGVAEMTLEDFLDRFQIPVSTEGGWILTVNIVERPLVPECFYLVSDDRKPDLLEGDWGWAEVEATPEIKEALLVLRRSVRVDGWPLVVELSKRRVLREATDRLWGWLFDQPDESLGEDEAGFVDCQRAWRGTELMAGLSDRQLEVVVALLQTWSGSLEDAVDAAIRLADG